LGISARRGEIFGKILGGRIASAKRCRSLAPAQTRDAGGFTT